MSENSEPVPAPPARTVGLPDTASPREDDSFPIVGVGASAGGCCCSTPRRVVTEGEKTELVLLAFEDVTGTAREAAP